MKKDSTGKDSKPTRRDFVKTTAAAGAGLLIVPSATAFGSAANSSLGLGIIGCGGRGNYDGGEFVRNTDVRVTALMDVFEDRVGATRARFDKMAEEKGQGKIAEANLFKGHRGYEKLVQSKDVDLVLVTSPPYFHPDHLEAAVGAGKHVYLEKPVATDVTGCLRVKNIGKKYDGKVSMHVGFQKRYDEGYRGMIERIHAGEIGDIVLGQSFYFTNDLGRQNKPGMSDLEARIRNWVFDRALSGDILVEQNIHIIDIVNWAMKSHPVKAAGTSGRALRKQVDGIPADYLCSDHFILTYTYQTAAGDVHVSFNSNQFKNKGYRQQGERFFGSKGAAESFQSGPATINYNQVEEGQKVADKIDTGKVDLHLAVGTKMKALVESIKSGKFDNQCEQGADSTLTTILGRTAAYSGREVTWDKMIKSNEKWDLRLNLDSLGGGAVSMKG
ncbi:MAG: Inositol 2-dehydrogenase/D-chiro-inositol 3-dehydrogenase [Acidobacteria bacterium]|nr:Inositol 2-dehydrogenase/D-chiro-inositol 3-dehydrogenase [Acidobacteriota bacterium]